MRIDISMSIATVSMSKPAAMAGKGTKTGWMHAVVIVVQMLAARECEIMWKLCFWCQSCTGQYSGYARLGCSGSVCAEDRAKTGHRICRKIHLVYTSHPFITSHPISGAITHLSLYPFNWFCLRCIRCAFWLSFSDECLSTTKVLRTVVCSSNKIVEHDHNGSLCSLA
jgi:hypothetical protein